MINTAESIGEPGFYSVDLFDCPEFRMFHNNDCPRAADILKHKSFEPMSMKLWCVLARTAGTVVDIGAHVGVYSLAAASLRPDVPVFAFEPNPDVYARLLMHINLNGFTNIVPERCAIADRKGTTRISWYNKGLGYLSSSAHIGEVHTGFNTAPAFVRPIDLTPYKAPIVMKIDVEGAERYVFDGMSLDAKPDIILETFSDTNAAYITEMTKALGYIYYLISEDNMVLRRQDRLVGCDKQSKDFNQFLTTRPLPEGLEAA